MVSKTLVAMRFAHTVHADVDVYKCGCEATKWQRYKAAYNQSRKCDFFTAQQQFAAIPPDGALIM